VRPLERREGDKPDRALQPFGPVSIYMGDDLVLFKSGAIVLPIGERSEVLLSEGC
jgi:hypothetical protein